MGFIIEKKSENNSWVKITEPSDSFTQAISIMTEITNTTGCSTRCISEESNQIVAEFKGEEN